MGLTSRRALGALTAFAVALLPALVQPVSAGAANTGTLFGVTGFGNTLSKIDPVSGALTTVATVTGGPNDSNVTDLTGDPGTHRIFGLRHQVTFNPKGGIVDKIVILTFNSQTGAVTFSPQSAAFFYGLRFDTVSGTLYALDSTGWTTKVVRVDPGTGVATWVADIGPNGPYSHRMVIAPQTHTIYVSREDFTVQANRTTTIFTLNLLTGMVSSTPLAGRALTTIIYDSGSNKLLGVTDCCPNDLVQADPATGVETFVGQMFVGGGFFIGYMTIDPASHTLFSVAQAPRSVGFGLDDYIQSINTVTGASTLSSPMPLGTGSIYFEGLETPADTSPPTTSIALSPAPNGAGWNKTDVTVNLSATDPDGVADVATVQYSAAGVQAIAPTVVAGSSASFVLNTEGVTTITYFAKDNAGNTEVAHTQVIRIDKTPPTVTYAGNAGMYTVDQNVAITCTAVDPPNANGTAGSGLASTTCANVNAPAYSFPLGPNTLSASAIDVAGNTGSGSTTFSVEVTFTSLCMLTVQFIESSAAFQAVPAVARAQGDRLCKLLTRADFAANPEKKAKILEGYQKALLHMVKLTFLTPDQAAILLTLSQAL